MSIRSAASRCSFRLGPMTALGWMLASRSRRSEEHTSELQSQSNLVCRLLLEKKKIHIRSDRNTTRLNSSHSQIPYAVFCCKQQHIRHSTHIRLHAARARTKVRTAHKCDTYNS